MADSMGLVPGPKNNKKNNKKNKTDEQGEPVAGFNISNIMNIMNKMNNMDNSGASIDIENDMNNLLKDVGLNMDNIKDEIESMMKENN
jgi:hypothetical protein